MKGFCNCGHVLLTAKGCMRMPSSRLEYGVTPFSMVQIVGTRAYTVGIEAYTGS